MGGRRIGPDGVFGNENERKSTALEKGLKMGFGYDDYDQF